MILNHRVKKIALARLAVTAETWSLGFSEAWREDRWGQLVLPLRRTRRCRIGQSLAAARGWGLGGSITKMRDPAADFPSDLGGGAERSATLRPRRASHPQLPGRARGASPALRSRASPRGQLSRGLRPSGNQPKMALCL